MRVAQISVHGCPLRSLGGKDTGGMNVYVRELSRELGRLGAHVDIFTRWHELDHHEVMDIGETVRLIHIAAGEPVDTPKTDIYTCLPQFVYNLRCFHKREGLAYDLMHSHYWLSAAAAEEIKAEMGTPHVATFHTLGEVKNQARPAEMESSLRLEVERQVVPGADTIVAFTEEERSILSRTYGASADRVRVIPCGADMALFQPLHREAARSELGIDDHLKVLLFAGRLQPFKGIDLLLEAVSRLPDRRQVLLCVVGGNDDSADELARLNGLASRLGIADKVSFRGAVDHTRMPLFYSAADLCIVPSYHESFGLVAVEALACGTPVVASRVGGLATIVKHGETGFLVDDLAPEAFARCIDMLLRDDALRTRMGQAAPCSVAAYSWPSVAQQVLALYRELAGA